MAGSIRASCGDVMVRVSLVVGCTTITTWYLALPGRAGASGLAGLDFAFGFAVAIRQIGDTFAVDRRKLALFAFTSARRFVAVKGVLDDDHLTPFALNARAFVTPSVRAYTRFLDFL